MSDIKFEPLFDKGEIYYKEPRDVQIGDWKTKAIGEMSAPNGNRVPILKMSDKIYQKITAHYCHSERFEWKCVSSSKNIILNWLKMSTVGGK